VSLALVGLMCSLPFLQPRHTNPITSFYSEWLAFVLGCAALVPLVFARYYKPLRLPIIALTPLALAAVVLVHVLLLKLPYPQQALLAIVCLIWCAGLMIVAALLRQTLGLERCAVGVAWFLLASGVFGAVAGVLQHYEVRGFLEPVIATKLGAAVYGNLGQPNHFADHLALAIASLVLLHALGRVGLRFAVPMCALMLFVLSLSGSRSTWLYLGAMAVLAVVAYRKSRSKPTRIAVGFTLALLPGFALAHIVAALPWLAPSSLHTTVIDRMFELAGTSSERLQIWRMAGLIFTQSPLFGIGWGQFSWHYFLLGGTVPGVSLTGLYNHAHNLFLQLLAETGLVGAGIIAIGSVIWVLSAVRLLGQPAGWWILATAAVLGVHSMLEYPLWNAYFLGVAAVLLGLGDARCVELHQARLVRAFAVAFVPVSMAGAVVMLDHYHRLESVLYSQYTDANRAALDRSHQEMMAVRAGFILSPWVELAYARDISLETAGVGQKLAFVERVMRLAPTGMVAYRLAALYALDGDERKAHETLQCAVAIYPSMLKEFTNVFRNAETGNREAQSKFTMMLEAQLARQAVQTQASK